MAASAPPTGRSTIEHVATAAGVSVATVSRALRGLPNVAVATRARVQEAARELNYRADPAASRLAAGRSHAIAVVVPWINSWYFSNVVAGAEAVCTEGGYDLLVVTAPSDASRHDVIATAATLQRRVDGLIFVEVALRAAEVAELVGRGFGVVTIGRATATFPAVRIDNVRIGRLAVGHLVRLGHRRVGIVGAQVEDPAWFDVPGRRIEGARRALADVGVPLEPALVVNGEFTVDGGRDAARVLLGGRHRPTAIFALSDEMAFGVMLAARDLGLAIPRDVSLVGVDDHDVAEVVGLTTVRQRVVEHGAIAARALLHRLTGAQTSTGPRVTAPELVVRTTCLDLDGRDLKAFAHAREVRGEP